VLSGGASCTIQILPTPVHDPLGSSLLVSGILTVTSSPGAAVTAPLAYYTLSAAP